MSLHWIDAQHRTWIQERGLDDFDALWRLEHSPQAGQRPFAPHALKLDVDLDDGPTRSIRVLREVQGGLRHVLRRLARVRGPQTEVRGAWQALDSLTREGIECPRPLVCLERGRLRPKGALVIEEPDGTAPLTNWLAGNPFQRDTARRAAFFSQFGRILARMHQAGVSHQRLNAEAFAVTTTSSPPRIVLIDVTLLRRRGRVGRSRRIHDLARLLLSLPQPLADTRDRRWLLDAYVADSALEDQAAAFLAALGARIRVGLRPQGRHETDDWAQLRLELPQLEPYDGGRLWMDPQFRSALHHAGLTSFEAIMHTRQGRLLRTIADRENWRLELDDGRRGLRGAYLKRHLNDSRFVRLQRRLPGRRGESAGLAEARNIARLERGGVPSMRLIACGERQLLDGRLESFVLTDELVGFQQLDHFLAERFSGADPSDPAVRRRISLLIRDVADVAGRFHRLGYNHRDLYCCHFFIKEGAADRFEVRLIDLQRVEHRNYFRQRWVVKDLAQLAYSAPRQQISCTQRMAFMKRYLGVRRLRPSDKRLIRQILFKQHLMERTVGVGA